MSSPRSFRHLDELIHSGAKDVSLESDITLTAAEEPEYLEGISLDIDDLTIDGNGHCIDALGKVRIFTVTGKNITLKNVHLKNGFSKSDGGCIFNRGSINIFASTITDNQANEDGGAIANITMMSLSKCEIKKNTSQEGRGGAIANVGNLTITESEVSKNTAKEGKCGAIANGRELTVEKSRFENNTSKYDSGAIGNYNAKLIIKKSVLKSNMAKYDGGAIYNSKGEISIMESELNENTSIRYGGAIYSSNESHMTITKSTLNGNNASTIGGAIYNSGESSITQSRLNENSANDGGGAIFNSAGTLDITESTLNANSSHEGGAINNRCILTISKSTLNSNTAHDGGAIRNIHNFKAFNCEISNNESQNNIILNEDSMHIYGSEFKNNRSRHIIFNDNTEYSLSVIQCKFIENHCEETVMFNRGSSCILEGTAFEANRSKSNAKNIINQSNLTLTDVEIADEGKTILNNGHILIKQSSQNLEGKIHGNGTVEFGYFIPSNPFDFGYLDEKIRTSPTKEISLDNDISFATYEIDFYEGGIEIDTDGLVIDGKGKTIDGNGKSRIFIITGKGITLKNIIFKNGHSHKNRDNPLNNNGGALRINRNANLKIINCKFINNSSQDRGGAISNSDGELTMIKSLLKENAASEGGAIYNQKGGLMNIVKSTLSQNTQSTNHETQYKRGIGGAIYNDGSELNITKSALAQNLAINGGAIFNDKGGSLVIEESRLTENAAKNSGGAIYNIEADTTIKSCEFCENMAIRHGGAIYKNKGILAITESEFRQNTAINAGAVWLEDSNYETKDCVFKDNIPNNIFKSK